MLATEGFCIICSNPPLAIICWANDMNCGLLIRLAKSGMPPPPPPPPPMFLNISAMPAKPGPPPGLGVDRAAGEEEAPSDVDILDLAFCRPPFRPALFGSSLRPRSNAFAAALKSSREYWAWLNEANELRDACLRSKTYPSR